MVGCTFYHVAKRLEEGCAQKPVSKDVAHLMHLLVGMLLPKDIPNQHYTFIVNLYQSSDPSQQH